jgi:uncharacterized protein YndB with AHSA1/START domain
MIMSKLDVTTPSDREIKVTRTFNAPAAQVFDCHTRAEYVKRWLLGPPGWSMPVCEIDLKVGGRYRYLWREEASGTQFGVQGEYREISAPNHIVHTENMDGIEGEMLATLDLTENEGRTTLVMTMLFPSKESRDQALQSGMTEGMSGSYDRLEGVMGEKVE